LASTLISVHVALIDQQLGGKQPPGYAIQARNHNAVAAAVAQQRADWGVAIRSVADHHQLGFLPLADEQYDFVVPKSRLGREAVVYFSALLDRADVREQLERIGLSAKSED